MSLEQIAILAVIVVFASFMQSLFGFGFALLAVPLMIFVIHLSTAVVVSTVVSVFSTGLQWYHSREIRVSAVARQLIGAGFIGMPFGLWCLMNIDPRSMKIALGCMVFIGVFLNLTGIELHRLPRAFDISMGLFAGVLATATSTNGPPLVFLLHSRRHSPDVFRAILNRVFTISSLASILLFGVSGTITLGEVGSSLALLPFMGLGVFFGIRSRSKIDPDHFRWLVILLLSLSGGSAIANALLF